ncbi:hypothetical protein DFH06DRAFT_1299181 [Mycena polygramma]|nr:hypothetical protein DFH06DRAFT_1299181 [Mycena polygramma]
MARKERGEEARGGGELGSVHGVPSGEEAETGERGHVRLCPPLAIFACAVCAPKIASTVRKERDGGTACYGVRCIARSAGGIGAEVGGGGGGVGGLDEGDGLLDVDGSEDGDLLLVLLAIAFGAARRGGRHVTREFGVQPPVMGGPASCPKPPCRSHSSAVDQEPSQARRRKKVFPVRSETFLLGCHSSPAERNSTTDSTKIQLPSAMRRLEAKKWIKKGSMGNRVLILGRVTF